MNSLGETTLSIIKFHHLRILSILLICTLSGCATVITGDTEDISITTTPEIGAKCILSNKRGEWALAESPGTVTVKRSMSNLVVNCDSKNGYTGTRSISTSVKATTAGNLLFGGIIGGGIDAATGAAFDYPDSIVVPMRKHSIG